MVLVVVCCGLVLCIRIIRILCFGLWMFWVLVGLCFSV